MATKPADLTENPGSDPEVIAEGVDSIAADLFGQEGDGTNDLPGGEPPAPAPADTSDVAAAPQPNSEEVQALGAPQTWTKAELADWASVPKGAQEAILRREQNFLDGISQYKSAAEVGQKYDSVVEPYRAMLAAENIDPVGLFQSFAGNHYLLTRGTPEQKHQVAASIFSHYGLDLNVISQMMGAAAAPVDPMVAGLREELGQLRAQLGGVTGAFNQRQESELLTTVESFATDPAHPHFEALADDIAVLLKTGVCNDLQSAYDSALWRNPSIRQTEIDRMTTEKVQETADAEKTRRSAARNAQAANVNSNATNRDGTMPVGTMEDTLEETFRAIKARGE